MLGRERDGGAAEGVVEPGVFGVGRGEEALEVERGGDTRDEGAGSVEGGEEAVPIDGEEEGVVRGEEGSARGKGDGTIAEAGDGEGYNGVGVRKFGDEDELGRGGLRKDAKDIEPQQRFETAFDGHPDGLRLKECLECA